jgi:glycosyltransferase involved in cell wall biosynthesis
VVGASAPGPRVVLSIDNLGSGGAQRQIVELAVCLRTRRELDVRLLTYQDVDPSRDRGLYRERLSAGGVPVDVVPKRGKVDPSFPPRLARWLRRTAPDVLHTWMPRPALWSLLALRLLPAAIRPVFAGAERSALANSKGALRALQGLVYRRCDAVTVNSRPALEELAGELHVARERLHYVPNGIDLAAWDAAAEAAPPFPFEPGCFQLALIGRFGVEKNHALLLDALARLGPDATRNWRVWFVGAQTGDARVQDTLAGQIRRRGLERIVRLAPPIAGIAALMRALDLLVLPSRYEGFPNVVLEAMASRLLVAAAPVGDVPSLVRDGETGLLFDGRDGASLAATLARARALSAAERAAITARARALVEERHRIEVVADGYLDLYRELAAQRAARAARRRAA